MQITKKKIAAVVATTTVVALGAGTAFAYWSTTGRGDGAAAAGTDFGMQVAQANVSPTSALNNLHPGESAFIDYSITNTATFNQYAGKVVVTASFNDLTGSTPSAPITPVTSVTGALSANACTIGTGPGADFVVTQPSNIATDLAGGAIPATYTYLGGGSGSGTGAALALQNRNADQDNCKNRTVYLHFELSDNN
jgi:hypothetical protein